jgi:5'-nucleotidase
MRILLTNDDGILAHGLKVLEKIARHFTDDVWVVAPELDQSGASHSLTLREPLRIRHVSEKKYAISGTPTDCVLAAVSHIMTDKRPDIVLSGVNHGGNIAEDVTYSGTIAGAIEGTLLGIPSFALSLITARDDASPKWLTAEHFGPIVLEKLFKQKFAPKTLININFPDVAVSGVQGICVTNQGHRAIAEDVVECEDPRGRKYYWIGAGTHRYEDQHKYAEVGSDLHAILDNAISITPLSLNLTHTPTMERLKDVFSL